MIAQRIYVALVAGTSALLLLALAVAGSPPALCALLFAALLLRLVSLRRGRPLVLRAWLQILLYLASVGWLVAGLGLRRGGLLPGLELLLLLATIAHLGQGDRGGSMFTLLCQMLAALVLQALEGGGLVQMLALLVGLPLLVLQLLALCVVESQHQQWRHGTRNRVQQGAGRLRRPAAPPAPLDRGFSWVAGGVLLAFLLLVALLQLLLPRRLPAPQAASAAPPERRIEPARYYPAHRLPLQMDIDSFRADPARDEFVASVRLRRGGERYRAAGVPLYWKLVTYDRFDGRRWQVERGYRRIGDAADGARDGRVTLAAPARGEQAVQQEVEVVRLVPPAIPILDRPLAVELERLDASSGGALFDWLAPERRLRRYRLHSSLAPRRPAPRERARHPDARYRQLPRADPRLLDLMRQATRGAAGDWERVARLRDHLRRRCRYELRFPDPGPDPVSGFLFDTRAGHCELFASALVVLLRSIGLPARVVGGLHGGRWQELGEYYLLRRRDLHAWAEVHFERTGWVRVDATPAAVAPAPAGPGEAAAPAGSPAAAEGTGNGWLRTAVMLDGATRERLLRRVMRGAAVWAGLLGLLLIAALWSATSFSRRSVARDDNGASSAVERAPPPVVAFYRRALQALADAGIERAPAETTRELGRRLFERAPAAAALYIELAWRYQQVRFGGRRLRAGELAELERVVDRMAAALTA